MCKLNEVLLIFSTIILASSLGTRGLPPLWFYKTLGAFFHEQKFHPQFLGLIGHSIHLEKL
jgi:hypothetical protein